MLIFVRTVRRLSDAFGVAAAACLAAACVVVGQMVFVRRVLGESTVWQTEFVIYAVVAATLIGSPYVLAVHGHVNVDVLRQVLGPRARRVLDVVAATLGAAFCVVIAASGWRYFYEAWAFGWVTESVWAPPLWIVLAPLPLGIGLLVLQYAAELVCIVTGADAGPRSEPVP